LSGESSYPEEDDWFKGVRRSLSSSMGAVSRSNLPRNVSSSIGGISNSSPSQRYPTTQSLSGLKFDPTSPANKPRLTVAAASNRRRGSLDDNRSYLDSSGDNLKSIKPPFPPLANKSNKISGKSKAKLTDRKSSSKSFTDEGFRTPQTTQPKLDLQTASKSISSFFDSYADSPVKQSTHSDPSKKRSASAIGKLPVQEEKDENVQGENRPVTPRDTHETAKYQDPRSATKEGPDVLSETKERTAGPSGKSPFSPAPKSVDNVSSSPVSIASTTGKLSVQEEKDENIQEEEDDNRAVTTRSTHKKVNDQDALPGSKQATDVLPETKWPAVSQPGKPPLSPAPKSVDDGSSSLLSPKKSPEQSGKPPLSPQPKTLTITPGITLSRLGDVKSPDRIRPLPAYVSNQAKSSLDSSSSSSGSDSSSSDAEVTKETPASTFNISSISKATTSAMSYKSQSLSQQGFRTPQTAKPKFDLETGSNSASSFFEAGSCGDSSSSSDAEVSKETPAPPLNISSIPKATTSKDTVAMSYKSQSLSQQGFRTPQTAKPKFDLVTGSNSVSSFFEAAGSGSDSSGSDSSSSSDAKVSKETPAPPLSIPSIPKVTTTKDTKAMPYGSQSLSQQGFRTPQTAKPKFDLETDSNSISSFFEVDTPSPEEPDPSEPSSKESLNNVSSSIFAIPGKLHIHYVEDHKVQVDEEVATTLLSNDSIDAAKETHEFRKPVVEDTTNEKETQSSLDDGGETLRKPPLSPKTKSATSPKSTGGVDKKETDNEDEEQYPTISAKNPVVVHSESKQSSPSTERPVVAANETSSGFASDSVSSRGNGGHANSSERIHEKEEENTRKSDVNPTVSPSAICKSEAKSDLSSLELPNLHEPNKEKKPTEVNQGVHAGRRVGRLAKITTYNTRNVEYASTTTNFLTPQHTKTKLDPELARHTVSAFELAKKRFAPLEEKKEPFDAKIRPVRFIGSVGRLPMGGGDDARKSPLVATNRHSLHDKRVPLSPETRYKPFVRATKSWNNQMPTAFHTPQASKPKFDPGLARITVSAFDMAQKSFSSPHKTSCPPINGQPKLARASIAAIGKLPLDGDGAVAKSKSPKVLAKSWSIPTPMGFRTPQTIKPKVDLGLARNTFSSFKKAASPSGTKLRRTTTLIAFIGSLPIEDDTPVETPTSPSAGKLHSARSSHGGTAVVLSAGANQHGLLSGQQSYDTRRLEIERKEALAVIKVQAITRSFLSRNTVLAMVEAKKEKTDRMLEQVAVVDNPLMESTKQASPIKLQALVRGYLVRKESFSLKKGEEYKNKKTDLDAQGASIRIQTLVRGHLVRKESASLKKGEACNHDRPELDTIMLNQGASIKLQGFARGYLVRKESSSLKEGGVSRNEKTELDRQLDQGASIRIQALARGYLVRKESPSLMKGEESKNDRTELDTQHDHQVASIGIQTVARRYLVRKVSSSLIQGDDSTELDTQGTSIGIQALVRGYLVRKESASLKKENESKNGRTELNTQQEQAASIRIQVLVRGYLVRKEYVQLKKLLQRKAGLQTRISYYQKGGELEQEASIRIQTLARGCLIRKDSSSLKKGEESKIERLEQGGTDATVSRNGTASVILQSLARGYLVRKHRFSLTKVEAKCGEGIIPDRGEDYQIGHDKAAMDDITKEEVACFKLQAIARGYVVRRNKGVMKDGKAIPYESIEVSTAAENGTAQGEEGLLKASPADNLAESANLEYGTPELENSTSRPAGLNTEAYRRDTACVKIQAFARQYLVRTQTGMIDQDMMSESVDEDSDVTYRTLLGEDSDSDVTVDDDSDVTYEEIVEIIEIVEEYESDDDDKLETVEYVDDDYVETAEDESEYEVVYEEVFDDDSSGMVEVLSETESFAEVLEGSETSTEFVYEEDSGSEFEEVTDISVEELMDEGSDSDSTVEILDGDSETEEILDGNFASDSEIEEISVGDLGSSSEVEEIIDEDSDGYSEFEEIVDEASESGVETLDDYAASEDEYSADGGYVGFIIDDDSEVTYEVIEDPAGALDEREVKPGFSPERTLDEDAVDKTPRRKTSTSRQFSSQVVGLPYFEENDEPSSHKGASSSQIKSSEKEIRSETKKVWERPSSSVATSFQNGSNGSSKPHGVNVEHSTAKKIWEKPSSSVSSPFPNQSKVRGKPDGADGAQSKTKAVWKKPSSSVSSPFLNENKDNVKPGGVEVEKPAAKNIWKKPVPAKNIDEPDGAAVEAKKVWKQASSSVPSSVIDKEIEGNTGGDKAGDYNAESPSTHKAGSSETPFSSIASPVVKQSSKGKRADSLGTKQENGRDMPYQSAATKVCQKPAVVEAATLMHQLKEADKTVKTLWKKPSVAVDEARKEDKAEPTVAQQDDNKAQPSRKVWKKPAPKLASPFLDAVSQDKNTEELSNPKRRVAKRVSKRQSLHVPANVLVANGEKQAQKDDATKKTKKAVKARVGKKKKDGNESAVDEDQDQKDDSTKKMKKVVKTRLVKKKKEKDDNASADMADDPSKMRTRKLVPVVNKKEKDDDASADTDHQEKEKKVKTRVVIKRMVRKKRNSLDGSSEHSASIPRTVAAKSGNSSLLSPVDEQNSRENYLATMTLTKQRTSISSPFLNERIREHEENPGIIAQDKEEGDTKKVKKVWKKPVSSVTSPFLKQDFGTQKVEQPVQKKIWKKPVSTVASPFLGQDIGAKEEEKGEKPLPKKIWKKSASAVTSPFLNVNAGGKAPNEEKELGDSKQKKTRTVVRTRVVRKKKEIDEDNVGNNIDEGEQKKTRVVTRTVVKKRIVKKKKDAVEGNGDILSSEGKKVSGTKKVKKKSILLKSSDQKKRGENAKEQSSSSSGKLDPEIKSTRAIDGEQSKIPGKRDDTKSELVESGAPVKPTLRKVWKKPPSDAPPFLNQGNPEETKSKSMR
jgi:hypothetical protein